LIFIFHLYQKRTSYKLLLLILLNVFPLFLSAENTGYTEKSDSIRQIMRLRSHILLTADDFTPEQIDSLLSRQIPLAFLSSAESGTKLNDLLVRLKAANIGCVLIAEKGNKIPDNNDAGVVVLSDTELDRIDTKASPDVWSGSMSCKEFLRVNAVSDSLPSIGFFVRMWERIGKIPNFISANQSNVNEVATVVASLNGHPRIFGVVRNGNNRRTNGYFSFPVVSSPNSMLAPYKAGYQFSPDIILPTPEKLRELKVFNGLPLNPDFGLTDNYLFSKKVSNLKRKNENEIIPNNLEFTRDDVRGNVAFFSGKAYLDGGLMSRSALKPNFSVTAWIKPTKLGFNNCILGKGKDFVLKIHNGLLTFTVQGIKDYYSKNTKIPLNQWSFISLVHTSADNHISFYLNGELTDKISLLKSYVESDYTMLIGSNLWEEYFVGYMSELKIWDRELNVDEVRVAYLSGKEVKHTWSVSWLLLIVLSLGALGIFLRRRLLGSGKLDAIAPVKAVVVPVSKAIVVPEPCDYQEQIGCFGGLKVINSEGKDISLKFSPKLKQLFVLIFLHSVSDEKGISSKKLSDCLWPGMNPLNAKNIRGTNIQNLKALLATCAGFKLVFQDKLWILEFTDGYCADVVFVEDKLNKLMSTIDVESLVNELPLFLAILKKGTLLPNINESWIDPYIDRMSNRVIEFGMTLFGLLTEEKHDSLLLEIAEVISINDPLNEPALRKKISILTRQGKLSLAHSLFDNFTKLYFELYLEKYPGDFKSLTAHENAVSVIV